MSSRSKCNFFLTMLIHMIMVSRLLATRRGNERDGKIWNRDNFFADHNESYNYDPKFASPVLSKDLKSTPVKGETWPMTTSEAKEKTFYKISADVSFEILFLDTRPKLLENMIKYFARKLKLLIPNSNGGSDATSDSSYGGDIKKVEIGVHECCDTTPHLGMNEYYKVLIADSLINVAALNIWGIPKAFDTILQLCYVNDKGTWVINKNYIMDSPAFAHRGLMLDTQSRYISVTNILRLLDEMAMNKMNVLHWRIVGDTSFPYASKALPELSEKGALQSSMVYDEASIKKIVEFATLRGIRVIPEFNMPGHMKSMAKSHPEIFTKCSDESKLSGPLNLANPSTFELLKKLMTEFQELFPDSYIHIGGENVNKDCWTSNSDIKNYVRDNAIFLDLHLQFVKKLYNDEILKPDKKLIVAQETLKNSQLEFAFLSDALAQAYSEDLFKSLSECNDNHIIYSWGWNLANQANASLTFMYEVAREINKISDGLGGEALCYTGSVDNTNIFDNVWPRTCAVADVLWNGNVKSKLLSDGAMDRIHKRIEAQMKLMNRLKTPSRRSGTPFSDILDKSKKKSKVNISLKSKPDARASKSAFFRKWNF